MNDLLIPKETQAQKKRLDLIVENLKRRLRGEQERTSSRIDPDKLYSPDEVSKLLGISYDTAARRMAKMPGCVDLGSKERRYKRPKRILRVSGKALASYLRNRTV